ncbi:MAG: 30S ribosomal protein S21 [Anaerolineae bacterium]|nr:30S ribosomal protein S21 [Anaerolineae bacterium]
MSVTIRAGESQEALLKRWRKEVTKAGILKAVRKKRWFVSNSEQRRIAKAKAIRKAKQKQSRRGSGRRGGRR